MGSWCQERSIVTASGQWVNCTFINDSNNTHSLGTESGRRQLDLRNSKRHYGQLTSLEMCNGVSNTETYRALVHTSAYTRGEPQVKFHILLSRKKVFILAQMHSAHCSCASAPKVKRVYANGVTLCVAKVWSELDVTQKGHKKRSANPWRDGSWLSLNQHSGTGLLVLSCILSSYGLERKCLLD